jgi:hypothetical protein
VALGKNGNVDGIAPQRRGDLVCARVYVSSRWYSAVIAISMAWSFFFIIWLFRFFLFEVTLRTI